MAKQKEVKTNAMRQLEAMKISFRQITYECAEFIDGIEVADQLGLEHEKVYKTLVTLGSDGDHYVFVIPIEKELDLKAAARSVSVKNIEMLHVRDIRGVTGYVRGGCTAVGMKKRFVTRIDSSAIAYPTIYVSGGRIGSQIEIAPDDLLRAAGASYAPIIRED